MGGAPAAIEIDRTKVYVRWFKRLRDRKAKLLIGARVRQLAEGHGGDVRPVGEGISELRINYGPGYRVYFARRGKDLVMLLAGGDKDSQQRDIRRAKELARGMRERQQ